MSSKVPYLLCVYIMLPVFLTAQQRIGLDYKIKDIFLNLNTGVVLVKTSGALYGLDPEKKNILWKNTTMKKVDFTTSTEVPFSPYVFFEDKPLLSSNFISKTLNTKGVSRTILDVTSGKELFNSKTQGYQAVFNTILLPEQRTILVDGKKDDTFVIALFNFETGQQIWETEIPVGFFKNAKGSLLNKERVVLDAFQNIFWLKNRQLLKIALENGKFSFEQDGITSITLNEKGSELFVTTNAVKAKRLNQETTIYALDTQTLDTVWPTSVKVLGAIVDTHLDQSSLVVTTSKGFTIIDTKTGETAWKKSAALPLIRKIIPVSDGDGYMIVQENFLTKVNSQGKVSWRDKLKITYSNKENPVYVLDDAEHALFITPSRANRVVINSGKKIWPEDLILFDADYINRNLKLKLPQQQVWYNPENEQFPVYSGDTFFIFNNKDTIPPKPLYQFNFGRKLPSLSIRKNGYFMSLDNNYYYFDDTGTLIYTKEYPLVDSGSFVKRSFQGSLYWLKRSLQIAKATILFAPNQINQGFRNTIVSNNLGNLGDVFSTIYGTYRSYKLSLQSVTDFNIDVDSSLKYVFMRMARKMKNENVKIISVPVNENIEIRSFPIDTGNEVVLKTLEKRKGKLIIDEIEQVLYFYKGSAMYIEQL